MGVYSTVAAEQLRESQLVENFKYTDLLEFAVNSEVNNQRLFNAMIELDFQEAVANMNGSYLTETEGEVATDKKKNIISKLFDKIVQALKKFGELIMTAVKKLGTTLKELVNVNKQLTKKFGDLTADRLALIDKESVKDIKFTKYVGPTDFKFFGPMKEITEKVSLFQTQIYSTKAEEIDAKEANCIEEINKFGENVKDKSFFADITSLFKSVSFEEYISDVDYIKNVKTNLENGYKELLKEYETEVKSAYDNCKDQIKKVEKQRKEAIAAEKPDYQIRVINARLHVYNASNALYTKLLRTTIAASRTIIASDRASYAKLGALVLRAEKGQQVQHNSAVLECCKIDMLNEECIDALFA